jgi:hypothetical protein
MANVNSLPLPRSFFLMLRAGAAMEDETGEKVKDETTNTTVHLHFKDQSFGFAGSSGPSQVTKLGSSGTLFESFISSSDCSSTSLSVSMSPMISWTSNLKFCKSSFRALIFVSGLWVFRARIRICLMHHMSLLLLSCLPWIFSDCSCFGVRSAEIQSCWTSWINYRRSLDCSRV